MASRHPIICVIEQFAELGLVSIVKVLARKRITPLTSWNFDQDCWPYPGPRLLWPTNQAKAIGHSC